MTKSIVPVAAFIVAGTVWAYPAAAGSVGQEFLDQMGSQPMPEQPATEQMPTEADKYQRLQNYLFLDQDNLNFGVSGSMDSGLTPASGDDEGTLLKPGEKPVLPSYD